MTSGRAALAGAGLRSPRSSRVRRSIARQAPVVASVVLTLIVWEVVGRSADLLVLPPISEIMAALWEFLIEGTLLGAMAVSIWTVVIGLMVSILIGVTVGTLMGLVRPVQYALDVYVNAAMAAPLVAFVPVFILLFGTGYPTRVLVVILYALFPIIINTFAGMRGVDRSLVEMATSFGANRGQLFWRVQLPNAFPLVLAGVRLGTARGIKGLITGEVLIAVVGLGALVNRYGNAFTMDRLYALIFFLVAVALVLVRSVELVSRRLVRQ